MIGRILKNRYQILEILAQGAGSTTYKAHDNTLNRDVSLKLLPTLYSPARERFFQQARRAAQLSHPNIAAVYDVDTGDDGTPFVVSEYVEGQSLSRYGPISPLEVVKLGQQIASALDYAHQQGIIHADLNSANIRVTPEGQAKIFDLGLRLAETASSTVTATGALIANPAYLSPEQIQGVKVDVRSDIYALGVVLYELSTGQPPFTGDTPMVVLIQHIKEPPAPPATLAPEVPPDLEETILKALEKDPAQRYQSADALASALQEIAARRNLMSAPPPLEAADSEPVGDYLSGRTGQNRPLDEVGGEGDEKEEVSPPAPPPQPVQSEAEMPDWLAEPPSPAPAIPKMEEKKDMLFGGVPPLSEQADPPPPSQAALPEKGAKPETVPAQPAEPEPAARDLPVGEATQPSGYPAPADEKARSETASVQPPASPPPPAQPQPASPAPEPPPAPQPTKPTSSGGSLLRRVERHSSEPKDEREIIGQRQRAARPEVSDAYADLKSRIQNKLRTELNSLQVESPQKKRNKVEELFNLILAEDNILLSRAERQSLFDAIVADVLSSGTALQFSAHYPKEVKPDDWQPLHAYLYKSSAEKTVTEDASKQLGEQAPHFRKIVQTAKQVIQEGELVTATPIIPGFQFNPPSISVAFFEDWHRFDFKLRAHTAPLNQAANGFLTFSIAGVIVADIPLAIFVGQSTSATEQISAAARPYQAIFCSYSHDDIHIVERVERAYKALGLDYLRDVVSLKSGSHWNLKLLELIEKADIFQLFWSEAASTSPFVKQEWEYALKLNRDNAHFIRPVYWRQPMPAPPQPMNHIHFAYQPDLEK